MSKLRTLRDALLDELKDIYSAESQLLKALPKMEKKARNKNLKSAITAHLTETEHQVARLEKISAILDEKLTGKTCKAMQGLVEEGKEVLAEESENPSLIDALLIGAAQRVEHYEMAAYGTARAMAEALGLDKVVKLLQETLDEEVAADEKLSMISESEILPEACADEPEDNRGNSNKTFKQVGNLMLALVLVSQIATAHAESGRENRANEKEAVQYKADDTGKNVRDQNDYNKTAQDQPLLGDDTKILAEIRRKIVANEDLSTYAKNVKIIVTDQSITLRGPVRSAQEAEVISQTATKSAPTYKLVNQLEVKNN